MSCLDGVCFVLTLAFVVGSTNSEYLTRKPCKDVDTTQCNVHNIQLDPCPHAPAFCTIKRGKRYTLSMDLTPAFSAEHVSLSMYGDPYNNSTFSKMVRSPADACSLLTCPLQGGERRIFDVDYQLDKSFPIMKFPLKVRLWNEDDESKTCCFTFTVKIHK